ncbi:MAG TPA: glycosyltransferase family 2 protein [Ramlibacter sp.]|nr:glycosyltransferase family 2 protein [Ramlibacter sp.]
MRVNAESRRTGTRVIDLLLVSFNSAHLLERLRQSLSDAALPGLQLRLLALDNASSDGSGEVLRATFPCALFIQNRVNVGFGRANNQLAEHVSGHFVLLLNTDAFVAPETLAMTVDYMERHPRCGILGVRVVGGDGSPQPSLRSFPTPLTTFLRRTGLNRFIPLDSARNDLARDHTRISECDWVPGCYYLVRRAVLEQIGLFDPRFFLYFEEVDHCRRARDAGWTVTYLPSTSVVHIGGESAKSVASLTRDRQVLALQTESELLYMRKHFGLTGLLWHLLLVFLGDLILALKDLLKGRGAALARSRFGLTQLTWQLASRTALGMKPTR